MKVFDSRPDILAMFHSLNEKHFNNEIPDISVVWNTRMTTTAGYCRYKKSTVAHVWLKAFEPSKIDLSDKLFRSLGYDLDKIERTMIHEMVHAYLIHKHNDTGHSARFQRMMTDITGEKKNHRCHNYDVSEVRREARYNLICHKCGYEHGMTRKPKHSTYKHRGCGGKMTLKDSFNGVIQGTKSVKIF
jgi:predicted SprT family Zn-dependent metalloprotease